MLVVSAKLWFYHFWSAFKGRNYEAGFYLRPDWLPDVSFREGYGVRPVFILDNLITNLVETDNGYLENSLCNRSAVLQVFLNYFDRLNSLGQNSEICTAKDEIGGSRACRSTVWLESFLCKITGETLLHHVSVHGIISVD